MVPLPHEARRMSSPQLYLCLCVHLAKRRGHLGTLWLTWLPGLVSLFKRIRAV